MEMITLHELSVLFDVSVRVLRSRVRHWVQSGKFVEGRDWRRDDFVDDTHFVWKVSPESFARESGLKPVSEPVTPPPVAVTPPVNQPSPTPTPPAPPPAPPEPFAPKSEAPMGSLAREMLDVLKDQLRMKDSQIVNLSEQNKAVTDLNLKLTGQIVQQGEQIRNLLRLTGGKSETGDDTVEATRSTTATHADATGEPLVARVVDQPGSHQGPTPSPSATASFK